LLPADRNAAKQVGMDVYSQIKLFHQDDKTDMPVDPPDLNQYFKSIEKGERKLPELLRHILIRRTRKRNSPLVRLRLCDAPAGGPVPIPRILGRAPASLR